MRSWCPPPTHHHHQHHHLWSKPPPARWQRERWRERETATGSLEIGSAIAASADFEDLRTRLSVSDLQSATRQDGNHDTRKEEEGGARSNLNLSVSIWALQVTPKVRSGKITTRASIFDIKILNAKIAKFSCLTAEKTFSMNGLLQVWGNL